MHVDANMVHVGLPAGVEPALGFTATGTMPQRRSTYSSHLTLRGERGQYREFVAQFRQAAEMLKNGDLNAPFPVGTFPPGLPYVRGKPPPFSQPA
jgi:hypothetical protein